MTAKNTIDTAIAKRLVQANAMSVRASIIGQPGGWSVMLKIGMMEKTLGAQRTDIPRLWRSLDRCVDYLKKELNIAKFDRLDATQYIDIPAADSVRNDAAERMRHAHQAAAYDKWLRAEVQEAIDDPRPSVPHEQAMQRVRAKLNVLRMKEKEA